MTGWAVPTAGMDDVTYRRLVARGGRQAWTGADVAALQRRVRLVARRSAAALAVPSPEARQ